LTNIENFTAVNKVYNKFFLISGQESLNGTSSSRKTTNNNVLPLDTSTLGHKNLGELPTPEADHEAEKRKEKKRQEEEKIKKDKKELMTRLRGPGR
jgi:hypothetical protein